MNAKFGHSWVKKHHFDNKGKLPAKVESLARKLIERDDAPKLGLGKTGLKFARMNSKEAFKPAKGGQSDAKWATSLKLRAHLAGEKPSAKMQSRDAVGKVPRAMKGVGEQITAPQVVAKLLD